MGLARYAGVIATSGDTVLIVREEHDQGGIIWGFPTGAVEADETFPEGAARELAEESGLVVRASDLTEVCRVELRMIDGIASDAVTFTIEVEQHDIVIDDPDGSILEGAWVPIAEALQLITESRYLSMVEPPVHFLTHRTPSTWRYRDPREPGTRTSP